MKQQKLLSILLCLALTLSLAFPALAAEPYSDVAPDSWYAEAADYCAEHALMFGVGETRFDPEGEVTRAMVVTVLHRISGTPAPSTRGAFSDVPEDAWYADAADWAAEAGIANGVGDGCFCPTDPVLRQDLVVFLWRASGGPAFSKPSPFSDEADVSDYALSAMRWAAASELVTGMGNGCFEPRGTATRAQLAVILMRLDKIDFLNRVQTLRSPLGIAAGRDGALLVTDGCYKRVFEIRGDAITAYAGMITAPDALGEPHGGYLDGALLQSLFLEPWAITPFLDGWAVSDARNNALRFLNASGVQTINGVPGEAGMQTSAMGVTYDRPTGLATDDEGLLYVADTGSGAIRRITKTGSVTTIARGLNEPTALCWFGGSLYVAETGANRILQITDGAVQVLAGSGVEGFDDGAALSASFRAPSGLTVGPDGTVYVSDTVNGAIRSISGGQVRTLLQPQGLETDPVSPMGLLILNGTLYICDSFSGLLHALPLND